jgi:hypothetical protein
MRPVVVVVVTVILSQYLASLRLANTSLSSSSSRMWLMNVSLSKRFPTEYYSMLR